MAVKVLKETATREAEEDFMREVDIMSAFRHSNILSLIGVVLRGMVHAAWLAETYSCMARDITETSSFMAQGIAKTSSCMAQDTIKTSS